MAKKYMSLVSSKLTPDGWKEQLNLKTLSVHELLDIFGDMKQMEALGKKVGGFVREVLIARGDGREIENDNFIFSPSDTPGKPTLDTARMEEDMGPQFMQKYRGTGDNFTTVQLKRK